ncbi:MaoC family dehydratase N-terminal domain-containing protein [Pseudomonas sp. 25 R 14]|uniref:MaoC family dehydratase N-terminal domain-containing protein n=1 Tax=Pseudomonas sp. 25 R 14 TaxID=1844109 RepID=UPI0008126621|nr:MaoC family dehydratase N-terminal domain-containing protein [Pseudomonas sp. 25 R 14]CRM75481.1 (3R)-hydroxyacyl-ACP dehydratase subunit HadC [Pseudomonas sp. 25 R 14]
MLDRTKIGIEFASFVVPVEKGRLAFFAKAIGERNDIYLDDPCAREAGYLSTPAPPTFAMVLDMEGKDDLPPEVKALQLDVGRILHGSQSFEYFEPIYAGDEITVARKIVDIFDKKDGALEFVVTQSTYTNQNGTLVAKAQCNLVYRN